jgi:cell division protein FtsL
MLKRWPLVGLVFLVSLVVVGCGVPQEEHDTVLAERDAAQAEVASLQSELARMQKNLATAESDLGETESDLAGAQSQISSLQSEISSLRSQISSLQSQLAGVETQVAELEKLIPAIYKWQVYTDRPFFNDTRLQKAICLILDEEEIVRQALPGKNVRFEAEQEWASGENDLLAADRLMEQAAYPNGFRLDIYYAPMTDEGIKDLVAVVKTSLSAADILVRLFPIASIEALPKADYILIVKRVR